MAGSVPSGEQVMSTGPNISANYPRTPVYSNPVFFQHSTESARPLSKGKPAPILASDYSGAKSFPDELAGEVKGTYRTPMACSRKLEFSTNSTETFLASERTKVQRLDSSSYTCSSVPGKASLVKVTALEFNLPPGHPEKCMRAECHNKRFIAEDGCLMYYCSKACERTEFQYHNTP
eukprot:TRINITY_DN3587_c0_g4_i1.p1 TRINITY_DN3587_c0_g4~~TRINITY_DN3587_c0_g4_i1.p1  ORF type:complete len:177 (+),score=20.31 TRINITY_DN3587_c0_g4_i1:552-1082(+)